MVTSPAGRAAPVPVQRSFQAWVIAIALGAISVIVSAVAFFSASSGGSGIATIVFGLIFIALFVFLALKLREGLNWARLTLTILGALSVLFTVIGLLAGAAFGVSGGAVATILNVLQAIAIIAGIVFAFQGEAKTYFR